MHRSTASILGSKLCPMWLSGAPVVEAECLSEYVLLLRSSSVSLNPGFRCCHPPSCLDIQLLSLLEHKHPRHGLPWQSRGWDSELLLQGVFKFDPWSRNWYPTCCTVWPTSPSKTPPNKQNPPRSLGVNSQLLYIVLNPSCVYLEHFYSFMDNSLIFNSMFLQTVVISCLSWLKLCILMSGHMCLCGTL